MWSVASKSGYVVPVAPFAGEATAAAHHPPCRTADHDMQLLAVDRHQRASSLLIPVVAQVVNESGDIDKPTGDREQLDTLDHADGGGDAFSPSQIAPRIAAVEVNRVL